ncbi:MAG: ABC transporter ATP-binding protein [Burkholderiaceae bacterium]
MLLQVDDLAVSFDTRRGEVAAVRGASFSLGRGQTLGIVGESGSGKSVSSYAVLRILDAGGRIESGRILYDGQDLTRADEALMRTIRGREIAMIFQNPRAALNPVRRIGHQIEDAIRRHARGAGQQAHHAAIDALRAVQIHDPEQRYHAYPFELSGGMCQRVLIAIALACRPQLLIADEPTTGLDVTTQRAIMNLLAELTRQRQMASILITHDLGLAAEFCQHIVVMKDGEVVETGTPATLFTRPAHPYTQRLIRATPRPGIAIGELMHPPRSMPGRAPLGDTLLAVRELRKTFGRGRRSVTAVDSVSFEIRRGETLGLVGESGSGKSTVSGLIARLADPDSGEIRLDGELLSAVPAKRFAGDPRRARIQMVFQDATDSLDPRQSARQAIAEPVRMLTDDDPRARVPEIARQVGLPLTLLDRLPHQLSGGQKARVGIARALAGRPELLILDEPTAALDVSIQAIVLNLLADLRAELGMTYLFVSHDLQVVRLLCDRIIVMRRGRIVETGPTETVMSAPRDDYTRMLLAAAPAVPSEVAA